MPEYKNALHSRAVAFYLSGDYRGAEADLKKLIDIPPVNPRVYNNLGRVLAEQGKLREAVSQYSAALDSVVAALEDHFGRAFAAGRGLDRENDESEFAAALLTCAEEGTISNPIMPWEYAEFLKNRGLACFDLGEYERACRDLISSILLAPPDMSRPEERDQFVFLLTRIAECDFKLGRFDAAALDFERLAELQPDQAPKLLLREVECWLEMKEFDRAREAAERLKASGGRLTEEVKKKFDR
jgi:tetratricopeptide (TPR) repeat protein